MDGSIFNLADTNTANIFIIIDGTDQYLRLSIRISCGSRDMPDDGLEQGPHVSAMFIHLQHGY